LGDNGLIEILFKTHDQVVKFCNDCGTELV
jgi:hypothetical protein